MTLHGGQLIELRKTIEARREWKFVPINGSGTYVGVEEPKFEIILYKNLLEINKKFPIAYR